MTHWGEFPPPPPLSAARICPPTNSQIDKSSIPEAADGSTERLNGAGVPGHTAIEVVQATGPGVAGVAVLGSSTTEVSVISNTDEPTIAIASTTWDSGKTACISSGVKSP